MYLALSPPGSVAVTLSVYDEVFSKSRGLSVVDITPVKESTVNLPSSPKG